MPPSQPPPWTGEEPRLPPRPQGGLGWGRCLNLYAKALTNHRARVHNCPPPAGSPRFARGTEPRARSVPPARRGNLKEGVLVHSCFYELWLRDWYNKCLCIIFSIPPRPTASSLQPPPHAAKPHPHNNDAASNHPSHDATPFPSSSNEDYNTNRAFRVYELPPSFRFPPLREGNREGRAYSVPPASRGNLKEGVINCCFFVNFGSAIGITR
jgi:hypothetical protein